MEDHLQCKKRLLPSLGHNQAFVFFIALIFLNQIGSVILNTCFRQRIKTLKNLINTFKSMMRFKEFQACSEIMLNF
ncbi:hypothetical protein CARUB_v10003697mg [Capsella rubella]|uniref:Uncharacterized protein n=1 Tax=Capsella rubella TaxID=81985 RepID=R0H178_9BRAS|nr:hypothetical protein CARUB_v10003697mg [Capsella rubella]